MSEWEMFTTEAPDDEALQIASLLPSSLKEMWHDSLSPSQNMSPIFQPNSATQRSYEPASFTHPRSPEIRPTFSPRGKTFMPSSLPQAPNFPHEQRYACVRFHSNREGLFRTPADTNIGDYVITEADRGYDLGQILSFADRPVQSDRKSAKPILRKASTHEIGLLPVKEAKENQARELCQQKATELGLKMRITGAEFQFDGKKLIFYYSADQYVDFRNLVRVLFKIFETRIWMVWHDGSGPVKDIFTHGNQK